MTATITAFPAPARTTTRYIDTADVAKLIRKELAQAFPKVKFSVRSKVYSGGSSITVGWTDGPTTKMVDAIVGKFQGGRFDGMIDMAYFVDHYITRDGEVGLLHNPGTSGSRGVDPGFTTTLPAGAERVHFGASFVFTRREYSAEMFGRSLSKVLRTLGGGVQDCQDVTVETDSPFGPRLSRDPYLPDWSCMLSGLVNTDLAKRCAGL